MGHEKILWIVGRTSKRTGKMMPHVFRTKKAAGAWKARQNAKFWRMSKILRAVWGPDN